MSHQDTPQDPLPKQCPLCRSEDIRIDGWASMQTRVQFGSKWTGPGNTGFGMNCFACLHCGFVGFFLGPSDLNRLRGRPVTSNEPLRKNTSCAGMLLLLFALGVTVLVTVTHLFAG